MSSGCPLCHSEERPVSSLDKGYHLFECTNCGFQFVLPRPTLQDLKAVYDPPPEWSASPHTPEEVRRIGKRFHDLLAAHTKGRNVLEVGCNNGFILHALQQYGYSVCGTDLSETALSYARRQYGLNDLYCSEFPPANRKAGFDIIIASHIIEHVIAPSEFVAQCAQFLKDGGLFLILTPNVRSAGIRLFGRHYPVFCPPIHLNYFSIATLRRVLDGTFEIVQAATESYWADPRNTAFNAMVSISHLAGVKERLKQSEAGKNNRAQPSGTMAALRRGSHVAQWLATPLFACGDWSGAGENISLLARKRG